MRLGLSSHGISLAALGLALGGCAPTPHLDVAPALLSDNWSQPLATPTVDRPLNIAALLDSPEIGELTKMALAANPELLAAQTRIDAALAGLRFARGAALPLVSISSGSSATRNSTGGAFDFSTSFAAIDASLSVDLWGSAKAGQNAAAQRARAARLDRDVLALALSASIARICVQRATLQARIALVERNLVATNKLKHILEIRQAEGVATRVDVGLQTIRVNQLAAERNRLDQALGQTRTALALLTGSESPDFIVAPIKLDQLALSIPPTPKPSEIVTARADVRAAEARIRAAGGDVAQARAAFLPQLDLSLNRSAQTILRGGPLAGLTLGADLLLPIFSRNRLRGDLDLAAAAQREAVQNYRQTLLAALAEIEDALAALAHANTRAAILAEIEHEAQTTAELAHLQYFEGDADLRDVLDAQDRLISAQDARAVSIQEQLEARILLYRATEPAAGSRKI